ncbi:hypothetical protein PanWU01x14_347970 [Parasponia andersonii]|uniref:Uncharacterized protein n=1 Tax=Parasponia andersonii TaxID=3476 RepID=A0A2P5ABV8_PARAD|nr:hypothetical protein PanWU01x14_347970 [Parasponia andersonii]
MIINESSNFALFSLEKTGDLRNPSLAVRVTWNRFFRKQLFVIFTSSFCFSPSLKRMNLDEISSLCTGLHLDEEDGPVVEMERPLYI